MITVVILGVVVVLGVSSALFLTWRKLNGIESDLSGLNAGLGNLSELVETMQAARPAAPSNGAQQAQEQVGNDLFNLANQRYADQQYESARQLWEWAMRHYEQSGSLYNECSCRHNIALCFSRMGRLDEALEILRTTQEVVLSYFANRELAGSMVRNIADIEEGLRQKSKIQKERDAVQLFERATALLKNAKSQEASELFEQVKPLKTGDKGFLARVLINQAICHERLLDYPRALQLIGDAFKLSHEGVLSEDSEASELLSDTLLRIKDGSQCQQALSFSHQCNLHLNARRWSQAEEAALQALDEVERTVGRDHRVAATILNQLAVARIQLGMTADAHELLSEAQAIIAANTGVDEQLIEEVKANLHDCEKKLGY